VRTDTGPVAAAIAEQTGVSRRQFFR
jgi:hypothetical protein